MNFGRFMLFFCFIEAVKSTRNENNLKKEFIQVALNCTKNNPVNEDEIKMIKEIILPNNRNGKCLAACVFKQMGMLDDKGMFDENGAMKKSEKYYPDDKEMIENARKLYKICKKVNDQTVSDGETGCERSSLLAACLTQNASSLGFST